MKKNLLLYILLGFLVIMNGFFLFKHFGTLDKQNPQRPSPANFIAKQLEFDATQLKQFKNIDVVHRVKMRAILDDIKASKDALFDKLSDETVNNLEIDSIATQIANKEKIKELETFEFFKSVSEICTESQKARFKTIIKDGLRLQGPPGGPRDQHRPPPPNR